MYLSTSDLGMVAADEVNWAMLDDLAMIIIKDLKRVIISLITLIQSRELVQNI